MRGFGVTISFTKKLVNVGRFAFKSILNPSTMLADFSAPSDRTARRLEQGSIAKDWDPVNSDLMKGKPDKNVPFHSASKKDMK